MNTTEMEPVVHKYEKAPKCCSECGASGNLMRMLFNDRSEIFPAGKFVCKGEYHCGALELECGHKVAGLPVMPDNWSQKVTCTVCGKETAVIQWQVNAMRELCHTAGDICDCKRTLIDNRCMCGWASVGHCEECGAFGGLRTDTNNAEVDCIWADYKCVCNGETHRGAMPLSCGHELEGVPTGIDEEIVEVICPICGPTTLKKWSDDDGRGHMWCGPSNNEYAIAHDV